MSEVEVVRDETLQVLWVAVEEARGEPGTYLSRARIMEQTNIIDLGEFSKVAHYLAGQGLIAEGVRGVADEHFSYKDPASHRRL
ncbi:MAG TPA: hypothetical protein VK361_07485 [Rubrobacteraceae bacterium]|nr:hypothetical protein [Rubrobacteraceae bacterium]